MDELDEVQRLVNKTTSSTALHCVMQIQLNAPIILDDQFGEGYATQHPEEVKALIDRTLGLVNGAVLGDKIADAVRDMR